MTTGGTLRGLSLTQPWATLVALGAKTIETRSWRTRYRGPLAIHAAKGYPTWAFYTCLEEPFDEVLMDPVSRIVDAAGLDRGCIVAVVELEACYPTDANVVPKLLRESPMHEREFGDFSPGRYAWVLRNVRALREPVPCRGYHGVWPVPDTIEQRIQEQLQEVAA